VSVGGRGTLVGAALGAILVNFAKTWFTGVLPEFWLFALGLLFVVVTIFLPKGILGLASNFTRKKKPETNEALKDTPVVATEAQP
jgi:urea transport system permease protein